MAWRLDKQRQHAAVDARPALPAAGPDTGSDGPTKPFSIDIDESDDDFLTLRALER